MKKLDFIKSMDDYFNKLNELYNTPVEINWIIDNSEILNGEFIVNDVNYLIECSEYGNNVWTYKFSRFDNNVKRTDIVNDPANKMSALSTIRNGMCYLIESKKPNGLIINVTEYSRLKLYQKYSNEICDKYDYVCHTSESPLGYSIFIWRDNLIDFDVMNNSFNNLLSN